MMQRATRSTGQPLTIGIRTPYRTETQGRKKKQPEISNTPPVSAISVSNSEEDNPMEDDMEEGESEGIQNDQSVTKQLQEQLEMQHAQMEQQGALIAELLHQQKLQQQKISASVQPPISSPGASPDHSPRVSPPPTSRLIKREPRMADLSTYEGADGVKLDEWLGELRRLARFYALSEVETVEFAVVHLRGAADHWWSALSVTEQNAIHSFVELSASLRTRFQPVTSERVAREQLHRLEQGNRHINAYIADFQRLCTLVPSASEGDRLFQFERGLCTDLAEKLRVQGVTTLQEAIALAARVGGLSTALLSSVNRSGAAPVTGRIHQMETDDGNQQSQQNERMNRIEAALNALHTRGNSNQPGPGVKNHGSRGSQQQRQPRPLPQFSIPGVPDEVLKQRWASKQCLRCGGADHRSMACPNNISTTPAAGPSSN